MYDKKKGWRGKKKEQRRQDKGGRGGVGQRGGTTDVTIKKTDKEGNGWRQKVKRNNGGKGRKNSNYPTTPHPFEEGHLGTGVKTN